MNIRKAVLLFSMMGLLFIISGCKGEEAVHTSAEDNDTAAGRQETAAAETEAGQEEKEEADTEAGPQETETAEAEQPESGAEAAGTVAAEEVTVEEPLKSQLMAELLSENELDTSVVDNTRTTKGCTFTLPEGFEASEDVEGMYVTGRYPIDASLIYYAELEQDMGMQLMTEASFKEQTQDNFREVYGEDVEVMIDSFEQLKMQGYPAFRIQCHYQVGDVKITQLAYAINADKSYVITYSQTNDYDRMEEYEASAQTIQVEY